MKFPDADDREFNFSFDKKDHEGEYSSEILEKKVDSLGWKVTLISIIIPCLIGVLVALSYFSITKKVAEFQDSGSATVQELSGDYARKLEDMLKKLAVQEKAVAKKLAEIGENADSIKKNSGSIKSNQSSITGNQKRIKSNQGDIKSLITADGTLSTSIESIQKEMDRLTEAVGKRSRELLTMRQQIEEVELRLSGLADMMAQKPDMETVDRIMQELERKIQPSFDASGDAFRARLNALEDRIINIERQKAVPSHNPASRPVSPPLPVPPTAMEIIEEEDLR